jgi:hypothetical protein
MGSDNYLVSESGQGAMPRKIVLSVREWGSRRKEDLNILKKGAWS